VDEIFGFFLIGEFFQQKKSDRCIFTQKFLAQEKSLRKFFTSDQIYTKIFSSSYFYVSKFLGHIFFCIKFFGLGETLKCWLKATFVSLAKQMFVKSNVW